MGLIPFFFSLKKQKIHNKKVGGPRPGRPPCFAAAPHRVWQGHYGSLPRRGLPTGEGFRGNQKRGTRVGSPCHRGIKKKSNHSYPNFFSLLSPYFSLYFSFGNSGSWRYPLLIPRIQIDGIRMTKSILMLVFEKKIDLTPNLFPLPPSPHPLPFLNFISQKGGRARHGASGV